MKFRGSEASPGPPTSFSPLGFHGLTGGQVAKFWARTGVPFTDPARRSPVPLFNGERAFTIAEVLMISRRSIALALAFALLVGPAWSASGNAVKDVRYRQ